MLTAMSETEVDSPPAPASPAMVAVNRRTRRRRKRRTEPQISRKTLAILVIGFLLAFVLVAVPTLRSPVTDGIRMALRKTHIPPEAWALIIAALVIVYLIPGVEDRILLVFGLKKEPRRNRARGDHRP